VKLLLCYVDKKLTGSVIARMRERDKWIGGKAKE
jgi:hypothetical protein